MFQDKAGEWLGRFGYQYAEQAMLDSTVGIVS
jgi:hypothetical protein